MVSKIGGQVQGDGRGVHANSNRMRRRNPAHLFRPRQHSGSPRQAPINLQPVSEHEPCLFLYHPACLLGLGMSMHGPANGSQTRMRCRQPPKHPRGMLATPGGDGTCWGGESRGVGSGGLGTSPNGPLAMRWPGPRPNALCVRGSAISRGQVRQRDASAMDAGPRVPRK